MAKPIVAIIGRPNVGKSTLFNRLAGSRVAIVEDIPGITRDRIYRDVEWTGRQFTLVDTGGIQSGLDNSMADQVRFQAEIAIEEADLLIFIVDAKSGITAGDENVADLLRRSSKPVLLVVNKVDDYQGNYQNYDFYKLGLGDAVAISAVHGLNIGDLLDLVVAALPDIKEETDQERLQIAVVGRPNVGKSSLVNRILGQERVIVSEVAGTTRDAIDTVFAKDGEEYLLIDTAGIRRRSRIRESFERYSVMRSLRAVDRSDVVLLLIDGTAGVAEQDKKIAGYIVEAGKAVVIVINKWDIVDKDDKTMQRFTEKIRQELSFMDYAPVVFISALTGKRIPQLLETIDFVAEERAKRIATGDLNRLIREITLITPPPTHKGKQLKIFYATQAGVNPPSFIFFVNEPELLHFSYRRYLENQLRGAYGYQGNPLRLIVRSRTEK